MATVYDPLSPLDHKFLTPTSFADMFAPSVAEYKTILNWLTTQGFVEGTNILVYGGLERDAS
jgi:subtilase family serine protease